MEWQPGLGGGVSSAGTSCSLGWGDALQRDSAGQEKSGSQRASFHLLLGGSEAIDYLLLLVTIFNSKVTPWNPFSQLCILKKGPKRSSSPGRHARGNDGTVFRKYREDPREAHFRWGKVPLWTGERGGSALRNPASVLRKSQSRVGWQLGRFRLLLHSEHCASVCSLPQWVMRNESIFQMDPDILAAALISSVKVLWIYCDTRLLLFKKLAELGISRCKGKYNFPR